jgi:hypothetical protein
MTSRFHDLATSWSHVDHVDISETGQAHVARATRRMK